MSLQYQELTPVKFLLSASQTMVASYRFDPFGNLISKSGSLADANVYRFSSKEIHTNSGMYYYLYRFYDPNLQRWINRDPVLEAGFLVVTHNRRRQERKELDSLVFAKNDAISIWDRWGLDNPGCDATWVPGVLPGSIECLLRCCAQHDKCFADHRPHPCTAASWPLILCPKSYCGHCNRQVLGCMASCALGGSGPPTRGLYYCAENGTWYDNWEEIPPDCWRNGKPTHPPAGWP